MDVALNIDGLGKKFGDWLFDNIHIAIAGNLKIGLIGDNGCGKSTLLKVLAGMEPASSGSFRWSANAKIGYLEQEIVQDDYQVSGGQKKILKITELFFGDYNILLLDEPDNHLDLDHKIWFEQLVRDFSGMVIVISHDRTFLENAVDYIWHMDEKRLTQYKFNYLKFKDVYEENMQSRKKLWETQEKERLRLLDLVARMKVKAATNDKFSGRLHNAEKRYDRWVDQMVEKPPETKTAQITTQLQVDNTKKTAVYLKNISKTYDNTRVLIDVNLHITANEKVAISAPNGSGKSTLLNIVCGRIKPTGGSLDIGPGMKLGYYSQEHMDTLDMNANMLDELQKSAPFHHYEGIAYLKRFLFNENQILSPVRLLSGGQKSRLQLAKFLATNPDILVLDEPTNHLDLKTVLALENFLLDYPGALVLVSHDRVLVERTTTTRYLLHDGCLLLEKINH